MSICHSKTQYKLHVNETFHTALHFVSQSYWMENGWFLWTGAQDYTSPAESPDCQVTQCFRRKPRNAASWDVVGSCHIASRALGICWGNKEMLLKKKVHPLATCSPSAVLHAVMLLEAWHANGSPFRAHWSWNPGCEPWGRQVSWCFFQGSIPQQRR